MLKQSLLVISTVLLLQGCAAAVVVGTAGAVTAANDRRTIGSQIDDNNIEIKSSIAISEIERLHKFANVNVISVNGIVLMIGQVPNQEMKEQAQRAIEGVDGIRKIHNQIRISSNIGMSTQTHDSWLTSKVKTQLLTTENISSNNIKVITENGEVFLMGLVSDTEANLAVDVARNVSGVERVIKVFEYL
ncbi:division/outer membrane stress-associated lipid-binding lipoprotein [uncultured Pseudoalteromonas sp.]|uniref:division/outer membrane stress-associated lipid-binding lipoprotein n=1 Tax=uncultured Pseudoalteromonas sp. TaxID=114053 RepID=UPI000C5AE187|nr:division/outer membrane stress-associated lipid-binding lipoprotein [uncultured Pseudoalteromonas sp.]MBD57732.1 osmotically-inducible protein OsmY [Pseudoalteromonas sp.]|tara:strand:+ start:4356 stop:4922 length:567 start_codon:yes stop_codon:yes gene_type:complete